MKLARDQLELVREFAIDIVYPKRCAGCGRRGGWVCTSCSAELALFAQPRCSRCGVPSSLQCRCASVPDSLVRVASAGPFEGWLRGAIIQFKYNAEWGRADHLGRLLADAAADLEPFSAFVPVPLHPARARLRGFNQAGLLAEHAAKILQIPTQDALQRTRRTYAQARLGAADRLRNVAGAFAVRPGQNVAGGCYVLVDDVITTGSTLAACADALLKAGASHVSAATVAREL